MGRCAVRPSLASSINHLYLDQAAVQTPQFSDSNSADNWEQRLASVHMSAAHTPILPEMRALAMNYPPSTYSTAAIALSIAYLLYVIVHKVIYRLSSPVRDLPGPKSVNWLTGSLPRSEWEPDSQKFQLDWAHQHGPVVKYYGWFNVSVHVI